MFKKIIISIVLILSLGVVFFIFNKNDDNWQDYGNEEYDFTLRYPNGWMVEEEPYPIISIHKEGEDPKNTPHLSSILIMPTGLPTGFYGYSDDYILNSEDKINGKSVSIYAYITEEAIEHRWLIDFNEFGEHWNEENYILANAESDLIARCGDISELDENYNSEEYESCIQKEGERFSGEVNKGDAVVIKKIIYSLKVLE